MKNLITSTLCCIFLLTACSQKQNSSSDINNDQTEMVATELMSDKNLPTVVDFYADWCGPCRQFRPIFKSVEKKYSGVVEFKTINVDSMSSLAQKYNIQSIPTILFINKDGHEVFRFSGLMQRQELTQQIESLITNKEPNL